MSSEIQILLQKAKESLDAAELLEREGYAGFSASRAYYSMFYATEALLFSKKLSFSSHSAVIAAFGKEFVKTKIIDAKFHRYLIDAQDLRNVGDYGVGKKITNEQAQEILQWAMEFISVVEEFLGS
jgi:uncharacterized protein (UPF0332 family)